MADPVSMGFMGLMAGGTALDAFGKYQAGQQQEAASEYNAALMEQQATLSRQAMETETEMMVDEKRRMMATQEAVAAKSGAAIGTGTPLLVLAEQAGTMERNILEQRRNRMIETQGLRSQAQMLRFEGKQAAKAGKLGALGSLLGGAGQMAMMGGGATGGGQKTASGSYGGGFTVPDYSKSKYMSPYKP